MKINILFLLSLLFLAACKYPSDDDIATSIPEPTMEEASPLLWMVALTEDTINVLSIDPFYVDGKIITSARDWDNNEVLTCYDEQGVPNWVFTFEDDFHIINNGFIEGGKYLLSSFYNNYCLDIETGEQLWSYNTRPIGGYYISYPQKKLDF